MRHSIPPYAKWFVRRAEGFIQQELVCAAMHHNDYRNQRHPDEQLSLGRIFSLKEHVSLSVRMELFNVFNRVVLQSPSSGNPLSSQLRDANGLTTSGFGYVNTATGLNFASNTCSQRSGQLVMRLQF